MTRQGIQCSFVHGCKCVMRRNVKPNHYASSSVILEIYIKDNVCLFLAFCMILFDLKNIYIYAFIYFRWLTRA